MTGKPYVDPSSIDPDTRRSDLQSNHNVDRDNGIVTPASTEQLAEPHAVARAAGMTYNQAVAVLTELYRKHFGRAPDSGGLNFWANTLVSGQNTPESIDQVFAGTDEAVQYTSTLQSSIQGIYWSELGRAADASGLAFWVAALRDGMPARDIRTTIHNSAEAVRYRESQATPQPDPRLAAMRNYNTDGNAIVEFRQGDNFENLAQQAYGDTDLWWVIAQANNAMSVTELRTRTTITIPDTRQSSMSRNAIQIGDNGYQALYVNRITGYQWGEYYVPASSQLEPIQFEENPNWLAGLAFVNGNDAWNAPSYQFSRADPNPSMTPSYWASQKDTPDLSLAQIGLPLDVDTSMLSRLPVFGSGTGSGNPPPPPVKSTPGSNPGLADAALKKYPEQVLSAVRLGGISVVTVKASVVEFAPDLRGKQIPGWPPGMTWDKSPGAFFPDRKIVVFATDATSLNHGSKGLFDHEFAHAYDHAMGTLSLSPAFEAAFNADYAALQRESPATGYYTKGDGNGKFVRAQRETYAESFANYYNGYAKWFADKPRLLNYFRSLPRPVQPGGR